MMFPKPGMDGCMKGCVQPCFIHVVNDQVFPLELWGNVYVLMGGIA